METVSLFMLKKIWDHLHVNEDNIFQSNGEMFQAVVAAANLSSEQQLTLHNMLSAWGVNYPYSFWSASILFIFVVPLYMFLLLIATAKLKFCGHRMRYLIDVLVRFWLVSDARDCFG